MRVLRIDAYYPTDSRLCRIVRLGSRTRYEQILPSPELAIKSSRKNLWIHVPARQRQVKQYGGLFRGTIHDVFWIENRSCWIIWQTQIDDIGFFGPDPCYDLSFINGKIAPLNSHIGHDEAHSFKGFSGSPIAGQHRQNSRLVPRRIL